jgi:hypothetical protein
VTIPLLTVRMLRLVIALPGRLLARHLVTERARNGAGPLSPNQRRGALVFVWVVALALVLMATTPPIG